MKWWKMKISKYYRLYISITVVSLSLCLFAQSLHASETNETSECGDALSPISPLLTPLIKTVGASNNTEIIETSTIDTPGLMRSMLGTFSFPLNQQKREIEIEYQIDVNLDSGVIDEPFLSKTGFKFLKEILDQMPATLLSKVNKITVLIKRVASFDNYFNYEGAVNGLEKERREQIQLLRLEEAQYKTTENTITLVIPYLEPLPYPREVLAAMGIFSRIDEIRGIIGDLFPTYLTSVMRHKLGYVMAYGHHISAQEWRDAILADNESIGDTNKNMAEDFAEAMALYLDTDAGTRFDPYTHLFLLDLIVEEYAHRFAILDEIVGVITPTERQKINEEARVVKERAHEVHDLIKAVSIDHNIFEESVDMINMDDYPSYDSDVRLAFERALREVQNRTE